MKETIVERWCPFCESDTVQTFQSDEHERDSSNDTYECLCGAFWMGLTGKYSKYVNGIYVEKQL